MPNRIKEILNEKQLNITQLSEMMNVSRQALSKQIGGKMLLETAERIAEALGVEMWELFADGREIAAKYQENAVALADGIRCPACGALIALNPQVKE